jgi:prevent-host-death family protein
LHLESSHASNRYDAEMQISVAHFRARCAELIHQVENSGKPLTITRRGRAVAVLEPIPGPAGAARPWEWLHSLGGEVHAAPGESVLRDGDFEAMR